jgi:hypothetical protein
MGSSPEPALARMAGSLTTTLVKSTVVGHFPKARAVVAGRIGDRTMGDRQPRWCIFGQVSLMGAHDARSASVMIMRKLGRG